jgi:hypothetical protein
MSFALIEAASHAELRRSTHPLPSVESASDYIRSVKKLTGIGASGVSPPSAAADVSRRRRPLDLLDSSETNPASR